MVLWIAYRGSFGFEVEEKTSSQLSQDGQSPVATALQRTQDLLHGTMSDDDARAEIVAETDPRALEKVRSFLKILSDNAAVCALLYGQKTVQFRDSEQVRLGMARLAADNIKEIKRLKGVFIGVLPESRTFEFRVDGEDRAIRGGMAPMLEKVGVINDYLNVPVQIVVTQTQVGKSRPRYTLTEMPVWEEAPLEQEASGAGA